MDTPEQIYEIVKTLPLEQATEVLDFAQFLKVETQTLPSSTEIDTARLEMTTDPGYHADVTKLEAKFSTAQ
jgi:hypothetical protein